MLLTVPAHPERFGPSDVWAGHVRRYGLAELESKVREAGLVPCRALCFGFPAGNLIEPVRHWVNARRLAREGALSRGERTHRSGVERGLEKRLRVLAHPALIAPLCWLQLPFLQSGWGTSQLVVAQPKERR